MGIPEDITKNTRVLPYNDPAALQALFDAEGDKIAAIIMEPICGNMGVIQANHEFILACRQLTTKSGALLIFDEVMTGFRANKYGGQRVLNITPDLTCLGKVIGGGLPCAAYGGRTDIMNIWHPLGMFIKRNIIWKPTGNYGGLIHG